jgi:hypothetical protein
MLSSSPFYFFFGGGTHSAKEKKNCTELEVNGNQLSQPCEAAEALAHAQYLITSVFSNPIYTTLLLRLSPMIPHL